MSSHAIDAWFFPTPWYSFPSSFVFLYLPPHFCNLLNCFENKRFGKHIYFKVRPYVIYCVYKSPGKYLQWIFHRNIYNEFSTALSVWPQKKNKKKWTKNDHTSRFSTSGTYEPESEQPCLYIYTHTYTHAHTHTIWIIWKSHCAASVRQTGQMIMEN